MSGRIRMDDAGPGTPAPPTEDRERQAHDALRSATEAADERRDVSATPGASEAEQASQRPAGDAAEASGEPTPEERPSSERDPEIQRRIDQLTRDRYEARRERDEARAQMREWQREQQQRQQPPGPEAQAEERAYNRMQQERLTEDFNQACNTLWQRGVDEYSGAEMQEAKRGLDAVGWGNRPDALAALTSLPDGHRVYRELATDLDNAARILSLPPMRMAVELARMSRNDAANGGNGLGERPNREPMEERRTRAPEPLRPVGGNSARQPAPLDQVSMAEFIRRRDREERGSRIRR